MTKESLLSEWLCHLTRGRRTRYKQRKQKQLQNTTPTIIGNDCVCGTIYRDLGIQYQSPTANVLIHAEDFFRFVSDLPHYLTCPLEEATLEGATYPVGVLRKGEEKVFLRFLHDRSFEEAKDKWVRRCNRVRWDNIYILFHQIFPKPGLRLHKTNIWYKRFKSLSYPNKRMLVNVWTSFDKEIVPLSKLAIFKGISTLNYPTKYSKKRLMDQFDYVSFLNKK